MKILSKKNIFWGVALSLFVDMSSPISSIALDVSTHEIINEFIAGTSLNNFSLNSYLQDALGFENGIKQELKATETKKVWAWLQIGGRYEDKPPENITPYRRSRNHFHNPLLPWDQAGYTGFMAFCSATDNPLLISGHCPTSAILWAIGPQNSDAVFSPGGDWSWVKVRNSYLLALTSTAKSDRDTNFADTFRGLGQVMHLLEDMSVPEHTRNSFHAFGGFEGWVLKHVFSTTDISTKYSPNSSQYFGGTINGVASFFDTDQYTGNNPEVTLFTAGLSEYSNANFFTSGTIFSTGFQNPKKENTNVQLRNISAEDGETDYVNYLFLNGQSHKLAAKSYFADSSFFSFVPEGWKYNLDDHVYEDYAQELLPRAIGYSAGLLSHFFRGKITLEQVGNSSTTSIRLKATNTTAGGELMTAGEVSLVLRYRVNQTSDTLFTIPEGGDYSYMVVKLPGTNSIPVGTGTEFTFDLSAAPLPDWANYVTAQLVYRGQLGNEAGAVAVGSLPLKVTPKAILVSLPDSGAYAVSDGTQPFKQITLNASTELTSGLNSPTGVFQLVLIHRYSDGNPYLGTEVATLPENQKTYYAIRAIEANGINSLMPGETKKLTFDLTATQIPLVASDVHIYLLYKANQTDPDSSAMAVGYLDISEPTPIDVYNNTDKVCLNGQWYNAGSPEAMAIADINGNGTADLTDIFPHQISAIYYQTGSGTASSSNYLLSSMASLEPGSGRRLGYILTDYYFSQSLSETVIDLDSRDTWKLSYSNGTTPAEGFVNQHNMGTMQGYSGMYNMRGYKMHGGVGVVFDNYEYPEGSNCDWGLLPQSPTP